MPVDCAQAQMKDILESIREFKVLSEPPVKTVVGLSNVSQGMKDRSLVNRTFLIMAISEGLDGGILDPLDTRLMEELITAEIILNKHIYCKDYIYMSNEKLNIFKVSSKNKYIFLALQVFFEHFHYVSFR